MLHFMQHLVVPLLCYGAAGGIHRGTLKTLSDLLACSDLSMESSTDVEFPCMDTHC